MNRAISWAVSARGLRMAIAFALTAVSFIAERQLFYGWCFFPDAPWHPSEGSYSQIERTLFYVLPVVFLLGFVWLMWELAHAILSARGASHLKAGLGAIVVAVGIYAAVGLFGYFSTPQDTYRNLDDVLGNKENTGRLIWVFWDVGFLVKTGNFSSHGCGY